MRQHLRTTRVEALDEERGFTLIELMVVVLIIAILIAIALPTYAGARRRAADAAAKADLRTALAAAMSYYVSVTSYTGFDPVQANIAESSIRWMTPGPPPPHQVDIQVAAGDYLLLGAQSDSGTYFCVAQVAGNPLTERGMDVDWTQINTVASCTGGW